MTDSKRSMIHAKCPYCGKENDVGLMVEEHGVQPVAMIDRCEHFIYQGFNKHLGREYVRWEFHMEPPAGSYSLDADVMRILNQHFKFHGPAAFAPSDEARAAARTAVEDFLRARGLLQNREGQREK